MNSAKLQGSRSMHRNQLYFYTLAINNTRRKLRKQSICASKRKIHRRNLTKVKDFYTENFRTVLKKIKNINKC